MMTADQDKTFLYEKAGRVLDHVSPEPDGSKGVSIEIILGILSLLPAIYKCWQDHQKATKAVQRPSLFQRLKLRRAVRHQMGGDAFRRHGDEVVDGLLAIGQDATEEDIKKYLASVGS